LLLVPLSLALLAAGCSVLGGGPKAEPAATASTGPKPGEAEQIDIRRYLGPDYCPELRILNGAELVRRYESGHEDDPNYIVWQASFGETARECLYDQQGGLTIKVGVSGRIIAGPKGGAGDVSVPFKIAVVKFKEAVLATEAYSVAVAIPPAGSITFTKVQEILVPSPGSSRDYILYVGFDVGEWDVDAGVVAVAPPKKPAPPPPPPDALVAEPAPKKTEPSVLPTPSGGFVLPQ
jgi:hypothetical protein